MIKLDIKSMLLGLVIGCLSVSTAFLLTQKSKDTSYTQHNVNCTSSIDTSQSAESQTKPSLKGGIESAEFNDMNSYFNGQKINLKKHLITVKESENSNEELYMPAEEFLTFLNFNVQWNKNDNALYLTMGQSNELTPNDGINNISINEADSKAIELIQNTGNWGYIEKYLPDMSENGIKQVVEIYNSKHINKSEHKKASDYLHK